MFLDSLYTSHSLTSLNVTVPSEVSAPDAILNADVAQDKLEKSWADLKASASSQFDDASKRAENEYKSIRDRAGAQSKEARANAESTYAAILSGINKGIPTGDLTASMKERLDKEYYNAKVRSATLWHFYHLAL